MKSSSYYLENKTEELFLEVTANNEQLRIRRGVMGKPCLIYTVAIANTAWIWKTFKKLKKKFTEKGYVQSNNLNTVISGSQAVLINANDITSNDNYKTLTSIGNFEYLNEGDEFYAWHFANGLSYDGDLDINACSDMFAISGLIIEGDVIVKGVFGQYQEYYPDATLILGNVSCRSFIHENSHVVIDGNLEVKQTIFGYYNDGSLKIMGDAKGEAMISYDHNMWAEGEYQLFHSDVFNEETPHWLNPKLTDLFGSLDTDELVRFIYSGKSALGNDIQYIHVEKNVEPHMETAEQEAMPEGETVEEEPLYDPDLLAKIQDLAMANDNMGMTLALVNWPKRNEGWLQLIQSRMCAPSASDTEKEMLKKALSEYENGMLSALEEVTVPKDYEVPATTELEWNPPERGQVWHEEFAHPTIKKFMEDLYESDFHVARAIRELEASEILNQHATLLYFEAMEGPPLYNGLKLVERLLALDINPNQEAGFEHECGSINPFLHAHKVGHTEILRRVFQKYPELEKLLPEEKEKETLVIDEATIRAAKKTAKEVEKLNQSAYKLQIANPQQAIPLYEQAFQKSQPYIKLDMEEQEAWEFNYVYALQGKLWCLNELVEKGDTKLKEEAKQLAHEITNFDFDHFYYSDAGALTQSAKVLANNTLAWYTLLESKKLKKSNKNTKTILEKALEYSNAAIEDLRDLNEETISVVIENKVRILMALEREEAYALTFKALKTVKNNAYLVKIAATEAYKNWNAEN